MGPAAPRRWRMPLWVRLQMELTAGKRFGCSVTVAHCSLLRFCFTVV